MALIESWVKCELSRAVQVQYLQGNLFSADNQGNLVGVRVFENGEPASLSGSVSANVIRADGTTVPVAGTLTNGNECYVILPQAAYAVTGVVTIVIKITASSVVTTLAAIVSTVYASTTDAVVDPGTIIPSIETLIAAIEAAVATIPADYSSLWATIAPAYTSLTFPVSKGQYCTNNGHMYRAKQDIATSETFTSSHWEVCNVGVELFNQIGAGNQAISELKSAFAYITNNNPYTNWTDGYIRCGDSTIDVTDIVTDSYHNRKCQVIPCSPGDMFTVTGSSYGSAARIWAFVASDKTALTRETMNATITDKVIIAPENAVNLVINWYFGAEMPTNVVRVISNERLINVVDSYSIIAKYALIMGQLVNAGYTQATDSWTYGYAIRVGMTTTIYTETDLYFHIATGYRLAVYIRNAQDEFVSDSGWKTGTYKVDAGTYFQFVISKSGDANITADEAISNVYITSTSDEAKQYYTDYAIERITLPKAGIIALMNLLAHVAYTDTNGQQYYNTLNSILTKIGG